MRDGTGGGSSARAGVREKVTSRADLRKTAEQTPLQTTKQSARRPRGTPAPPGSSVSGHPRLRPAGHRRGPVRRDPRQLLHGDRRPQRLRQVHAAARPVPDAEARRGAGRCWTARTSSGMPAKKVARTLGLLPQSSIAPDGITVADLVARGRYPHQGLLRQWSPRGRAGGRGVDGRDRGRRTGRPLCRRTVRRAAAARMDRDGAGPADAAAAARRADDVPRHPAPDRGARPVRGAARGAGAHAGRRAARPQPRRPLRHAPDRDARRARSSPRARRARSSRPSWWRRSSGCRARVIDDPETGTPLVVPAARDRTRTATDRTQTARDRTRTERPGMSGSA